MLRKLIFSLWLLRLSTATFVPRPRDSDDTTCSSRIPRVATFDDIPASNPITDVISSIGIYQNLSWSGFENFCVTDPPGIDTLPNTGACEAGGGPLVVATLLDDEDLEITANNTDSPVGCFDLESLYFGCVLPLKNSAANPPTNCDVTFSGYDAAGRLVVTQTESWAAGLTELEARETQLVRFSSGFRGVQKVGVSIVNTALDLLTADTGVSVDTVSYTIYEHGNECCSLE